jgi:hypothetical protein
MTAKFSAADANNFSVSQNIRLAGTFLSPTALTHWACSKGHSFQISLNSLKRRVASGVPACPECARIKLLEKRVLKEFGELQTAAAKNGLTISSLHSDYRNQHSLLSVTCERCTICTAKPMSAVKIKIGQACAVFGREKLSEIRRLSFETVQQAIANHPLGFTLLSESAEYKNNQSVLRLLCVNGHQVGMSYSDLQRRDRLRGCEQCAEHIGQSTSTAIVAALLAAQPIREYTPPFLLEGWRADRRSLRFDAFFQTDLLTGENCSVALEYHGPQHFDATHHFHKKSCHGAAVSFQRQMDGDQHKRTACANAGVALIEIDGRNPKNMADLCSAIIESLELALPKLAENMLYQERKKRLSDPASLDQILRDESIRSDRVETLRNQLNERQIDLMSVDTLAKVTQCKCRICEHQWTAKIYNLLDGVSTQRRGTGCPKCKNRQKGKQRRLTEPAVIARARKFGWIPRWPAGSYAGQTHKLKWGCATKGCLGQLEADFQHLSRRKCKICNTGGAK